MQRKPFRQQLYSSLNPDSIYQAPFASLTSHQSQQPNKFYQKNPNITKKQGKSPKKQMFLQVVSKSRKQFKRKTSQRNNRTFCKKNKTVILGGSRKSYDQWFENEDKKRSSLYQSCICQYRTNPRPTQTSYNNSQSKPNINMNNMSIGNPISFITQPNNNNQINRIVNHKLNLAAVPHHQSIVQTVRFNTPAKSITSSFGYKSRLKIVSTGNIFSSKTQHKAQQIIQPRHQHPVLTSRSDKTEQNVSNKRRKNAGFIRSVPVKKANCECSNSTGKSKRTQQSDSNIQLKLANQRQDKEPNRYQESPRKTVGTQISRCISKMSSIRKQINQLQSMLSERLQIAQVRSKLIFKPQQKNVLTKCPLVQSVCSSNPTTSIQTVTNRHTNSVNSSKGEGLLDSEVTPIRYSHMQILSKDLGSYVNQSGGLTSHNRNVQFDQLYKLKCPSTQFQTQPNHSKLLYRQMINRISQKPYSNKVDLSSKNQQNCKLDSCLSANKLRINNQSPNFKDDTNLMPGSSSCDTKIYSGGYFSTINFLR